MQLKDGSVANRALELLGKELGMFVEHSENRNVNYTISPEMAGDDARGIGSRILQAVASAKLLISGPYRERSPVTGSARREACFRTVYCSPTYDDRAAQSHRIGS